MSALIHRFEPSLGGFAAANEADRLNQTYDQNNAHGILAAARETFGEQFAIVSSFGAESAALLHIASEVDPTIPVLFLDTGKLFGETKTFRDELIERLGLTDVRTLKPEAESVKQNDPKGALWANDPDHCCFIRKVVPLKTALEPFLAWASGRKRFHSQERATLRAFDHSDGRVKVNPLAYWDRSQVEAYLDEHNLPRHPLVAEGFASIGCMPCTDRVGEGEDIRAGRWRGRKKSECGIHLSFAQNVSKLNENR